MLVPLDPDDFGPPDQDDDHHHAQSGRGGRARGARRARGRGAWRPRGAARGRGRPPVREGFEDAEGQLDPEDLVFEQQSSRGRNRRGRRRGRGAGPDGRIEYENQGQDVPRSSPRGRGRGAGPGGWKPRAQDEHKEYSVNDSKTRGKQDSGSKWMSQLFKAVKSDQVSEVEKILNAKEALAAVKQSSPGEIGVFEDIWQDYKQNLQNVESSNPLIYAVCNKAHNCVKYLVEKVGIDVNLIGDCGLTGLMVSVALGDVSLVNYLLSKGSNPKQRDESGSSLLHIAALANQPEILRVLLKNCPIDVNVPDQTGATPLKICASAGSLECIPVLLEYNALIVSDNVGDSPLDDLVNSLNQEKQDKKKNQWKKNKGKEKIDTERVREVKKWLIELALRSPIPTHAFEFIRETELQDILLEKLLQMHKGFDSYLSLVLSKWQESFLSPNGANKFIQTFARRWKKNKTQVDLDANTLQKLLKVLMMEGHVSSLEMICSVFYNHHNVPWLTPAILNAFSLGVKKGCKILIYGQEPYVRNAVEFVWCSLKAYLRMVLASDHLESFKEFDSFQDFWPLLDDALSEMDQNICDAERFACLIFVFFLWCQVENVSQNATEKKSKADSDSKEDASVHRKAPSLYTLETSPQSTERLKFFMRKHRAALIYLAEDETIFLPRFFAFIPLLRDMLDLPARSAIFSLILSRESLRSMDEDVHLTLNRMIDPKSDDISEISFAVNQLLSFSGRSLNSDIEVEFLGEQGIGDGPSREAIHYIFSLLRKVQLFKLSPSQQVYHLNWNTEIANAEQFFECAGRIVAASISRTLPIGIPLSRMLLKHVTKHSEFDIVDMKDFDEDVYRSLKYIQENDVSNLPEMHFIITTDDGKDMELISKGDTILVTNQNKSDYIKAFAKYRCLGAPNNVALNAFTKGFQDVIWGDWLNSLSVDDMFLLINGPVNIDISKIKQRVHYSGFEEGKSLVIQWFWDMFEGFEIGHRKKLLAFWTGSEIAPICFDDGSKEEYSEEELWTIQQLDSSTSSLPQSSTCMNTLKFPVYESRSVLESKFLQAIGYGALGYDKE